MTDASVIGWLLVFLGAAFVAGLAWLLALAKSSAQWASTSGRIVQSGREATGGGARGGVRSYRLSLTYAYNVNGTSYQGHRVAFGDLLWTSFGSTKIVDELVRRYAPGNEVTVFYDPQTPERCTLHRGAEGLPFTQHFAIGAALAVVGLALLGGWVKVH